MICTRVFHFLNIQCTNTLREPGSWVVLGGGSSSSSRTAGYANRQYWVMPVCACMVVELCYAAGNTAHKLPPTPPPLCPPMVIKCSVHTCFCLAFVLLSFVVFIALEMVRRLHAKPSSRIEMLNLFILFLSSVCGHASKTGKYDFPND